MRRAVLCWLLMGCGAVHLGEEQGAPPAGSSGSAGAQAGASAEGDAATAGVGASTPDAGAPPQVVVRVKPLDCGSCFELRAEAAGGQPPYEFEWQDGSPDAQRDVCVQDMAVELSVVASDADDLRSAPQSIRLESSVDGGCSEPVVPPDAAIPALCLMNPSFEGTPVADFGVDPAFDAAPWSNCTNPARTNMPRIGNDTTSITGTVPPPQDGATYLALGEGDQVSQELCSELPNAVEVHFEIDLSRIDLSGGTVPQTEALFLEVWGGLSVNCSQHERLWVSENLDIGWQRFCVTLRPSSFTTQLTLRGNSDMTSPSPAYLLVDNLQPVDSCP